MLLYSQIKLQMYMLIIILLFSFSFSSIITVAQDGTGDYSVIQDAINISIDGDTILVSPGLYEENLLINKEIMLTSYAIYDNLSDVESWTEYEDQFLFEWQVTNENILNTIIDGNNSTNNNARRRLK